MSGLGESILACSPPSLDKTAPMAYDVLDSKIHDMDEHIDNMVRRHDARANPDITPEILNNLVNGEVRPRAMAIAQVYYNAAQRMLDWDMDRIYKMRSYRYKVLYQLLSPNFDPPDRASIE